MFVFVTTQSHRRSKKGFSLHCKKMKQKCTKTKNARLHVVDSLIITEVVNWIKPKFKQRPWYSNLDVLFFMHKVQQRRYLRANWKCMMSMLIIRISNANNIWVGLLILIMLIEIDYINWTLSGKLGTMNHVFVSFFLKIYFKLSRGVGKVCSSCQGCDRSEFWWDSHSFDLQGIHPSLK